MGRGGQIRGGTLISVLVLASLIFLLVTAMAGAGFHHLSLTTRASNAVIAQNLADSAVSKVIERVLQRESELGTLDYGSVGNETVEVRLSEGPDNARGVASFDPDFLDDQSYQLWPSINNLTTDASVEAQNGTTVPAHSLYIVGYGTCGGVEKKSEAIISIPRFPYSIASEGPLDGKDIFIAGLADGVQLTLGSEPNPDDLRPGSLVTNDTSGNNAVRLRGESVIKGNLESASGAEVDKEAVVEGKLELYSEKTIIPELDISSYKPALTDPGVNRSLSSIEDNLTLDSVAHYDQSLPLTVLNGLTLNGGVLYVEGDLIVKGGISGKGAVIAEGDITVLGGGSVQTDNLAALLAGGDITIDGSAPDPKSAIFEGLVYAGGRLEAKNVSLVGVALSKGHDGTQMENARFYEQPEYAEVSLETQSTSVSTVDPNRDPWGPTDFSRPYAKLVATAPGGGWHNTTQIADRVEADLNQPFTGLWFNTSGLSPAEIVGRVENLLNRPLAASEREDLQVWIDNGWEKIQIREPGNTPTVNKLKEGAQVLATPVGQTVTTTGAVFSLDLAEFISPSDRMRVRLWRTL